jgi:hypothetical protein
MRTKKADDAGGAAGRERRAWLRRVVALAVLLAAVLCLAACGGGSAGPGVASGGSSTSTTASSGGTPSGSTYDKVLAYSRCMRAHGIADFPDPSQNGPAPGQAGIDTSSARFRAAENACRSLAPSAGRGGNLSPAQRAQLLAQELKFSRCMRAHGISKFPDPGPSGNLDFDRIDRNSLQYQRAWQACRSDLPNNGPKKPPGGGGGQ